MKRASILIISGLIAFVPTGVAEARSDEATQAIAAERKAEATPLGGCDKKLGEKSGDVERPMGFAARAIWGTVSEEWVTCRIDAGEVTELTFLERTGSGIAVLTDGRRVEFSVNPTRGAWFAARAAEAGVSMYASETPKLPEQQSSSSSSKRAMLGPLITISLVLLFAGWMAFRYLRERRKVTVSPGSSILKRRGNNGGDEVPDTRFTDVAGCAEAIEDLREIVEVLRAPERFEALGAVAPKGALLVGPPGTGKTLLARAVAGEAGVPFFAAAGSDFVEMYVGVGAKRVRSLFERARKAGGGIVFIDEVDAVGRKRSEGQVSGGEQESENTLIALLNELDGFRQANIVVLAATNRPDVLDAALVRPGRLDRRIHVGLPDEREREAILAVHLRGKPLAESVSIQRIAKRTAQMSGAQLAQVCNEAALLAAREGAVELSEVHLAGAVEYTAMGRARKSAKVHEQDRLVTAWHEAGHTVCALLQPDAEKPVAVSIVPRGEAGGVTWMASPDMQLLSRAKLRARLVVALGGRAAEEILMHGEHTAGASSDLQQATDIARAMVDRFGMTGRGLAVRVGGSDSSEDLVNEMLQTAMDEARSVLQSSRTLLDEIVAALLANDDLDEAAIDELVSTNTSVAVV